MRPCHRVIALALLVTGLGLGTAAQGQVSDDFESYNPGDFPTPTWDDVGTVLPEPPIPPIPSASVITTTDAFGAQTQAVATSGELGSAKGIYTPVPVSSNYSLQADVRVDRYSDHPSYTTADWAMQLTFAQAGVESFAITPQAGIYASSLTEGWRLFLISTNSGPYADIDLLAGANVGTWYHLQLELDVVSGAFHSLITDIAGSTVVSDQTNFIDGWLPEYGVFDSFAFFGGELSPEDTYGNIGVVDNVNIVTQPVPEPASVALLGVGLLGGLGVALRRRRRMWYP